MKNKNLFNGRFVFDVPSGPKETASVVQESTESTETTNPAETAEDKKTKENLAKDAANVARQIRRDNLINSIKDNNHTPNAAKTAVFGGC